MIMLIIVNGALMDHVIVSTIYPQLSAIVVVAIGTTVAWGTKSMIHPPLSVTTSPVT